MSNRLTDEQLEVLLERAAHRGACRALKDVGLEDDGAANDIRDLRQLIDGWRDVKKSVIHTFAKWVVLVILGIISVGAWTNFND